MGVDVKTCSSGGFSMAVHGRVIFDSRNPKCGRDQNRIVFGENRASVSFKVAMYPP